MAFTIMRRKRQSADWETEVRRLVGNPAGGLTNWSDDDVITYLRKGRQFTGLQIAGQVLARNLQEQGDGLIAVVSEMPDDAVSRLASLLGVGSSQHHYGHGATVGWLDVLSPTYRLVPAGGNSARSLLLLEAAGSCLGFTPQDMVDHAFGHQRWYRPGYGYASCADFSEWMMANEELIRPLYRSVKADSEQNWTMLARANADALAVFAAEVAAAATASSKSVRKAIGPAIDKMDYGWLAPELEKLATDGSPATRTLAVEELGRLVPDDQRGDLVQWAEKACANDRSSAVKAAVAALGRPTGPTAELSADLPVVDFDASLAPAASNALAATGRAVFRYQPDENLRRIADALDGKRTQHSLYALSGLLAVGVAAPDVLAELKPVHCARLVLAAPGSYHAQYASRLVRATGHPTPLELHVVADHDGVDAESARRSVLWLLDDDHSEPVWTSEQVTAWAAHNLHHLERYLTETTSSWQFSGRGLFRAISLIEPRPTSLAEALIECGISGPKAYRAPARALFGPDVADQVIPALSRRRVAERTGAADWLRELRATHAEDALRTAFDKEKQDAAKAVYLSALEAIGAPIDEYLSRERLQADAEKALSKKTAVPKDIGWLNLDGLPDVRWDDGTVVDRQILQWFITSSVKAKSAEPSPIMRRHIESMNPDDTRRFAEALFESWLSEDLALRDPAEAAQMASQQAPRIHGYAQQYPDAYDQYRGMSIDQIAAVLNTRLAAEVVGSAASSKGLLAVVAAAGGPELVPRVYAYLKKYRGNKLSQGKAMLQMLAWMDYPAAIQVVLTVSQRFRPKAFQKEATTQAELLAERRGWTVADLADRTVPRGGFDDDGRMVIDYGDRTFTAHLTDELTVQLTNDETGKTIKSLPTARASEDEAEVKELKKDLTAAKKEIKAAAALQPIRLYEAMCTERSWDADDFQRYIIDHPLMRRLAARLTWLAETDDGSTLLFRPLSDGGLIDADDDDVDLPAGATVKLAHEELVDADQSAAWIGHLADYEVAPLFPQFDRPRLPEADDDSVITDHEGHMIDALALRGQINKLGWQTGPAQDAGIVGEIVKEFPSADLQAVIEISGMPSTAESWEVAILALYFGPLGRYVTRNGATPLDQVPPIVLRETYAEMATIAAAGTGQVPDWKNRVS